MKKHEELCMEIISLNLMNYWKRIVLSVFIIEIFKRWLFEYLNFWMDHPHKLWMKSSRLNRQPHTIWGIKNELYSRNSKTVAYGTESVSFMAPKIWSIVPQELKNSQSLYSFKKGIRKWKPNCPCRLCNTFLQHVGFIK